MTHRIHFVRIADLVLMLNEGRCVSQGTYQEVIDKDEFSKTFLRRLEKTDENVAVTKKNISFPFSENADTLVPSEMDRPDQTDSQPMSKSLTSEAYTPNSIGILTYLRYFWAGGLLATLLLMAITILSNLALLLGYWWMQSIATCSDAQLQQGTNRTNTSETPIACPWYFDFRHSGSLSLLAAFIFSGSVFMFLRGLNFYYILLQASRRLHNRMLRRLVHTPMHFFDTNPSGRILNRFSKDLGFMDEQLPKEFYEFWQYSTYNLAAAIAICAVQPFMVVPFILMAVSTLTLRYFYLRSSKQIKHLESIARSPLYSHISLTMQGISTVRALGMEERMAQDLHFFQDEHARAWYHYVAGERWFGLRVDLFSVLVIVSGVFTAFFTNCVFAQDDLIDFSLPLLFSIAILFQFMVRLSGQVEIYMVSVDRVLKYVSLPQEKTIIFPSTHPCSHSTEGRIEYKNILFKYSEELPYVLKNVSLTISAGEKIGIIGRTGAGKTSLFNSLLRVNELSGGSITVDYKDIQSLDLYEHRKKISVIPQDPFLFSGTLRYNLDPFDQFSTAEIWDALDKSHLKSMVESLLGQLGGAVEEDGHNFSAGDKQLLCLARAMLKKNNIILIDEATANVDLLTDQLVQQAIRSHFSHCSVLTIAHRIETIIDSDRIIVLENGRITEMATPSEMLRNKESYLSRLLSQLDPALALI